MTSECNQNLFMNRLIPTLAVASLLLGACTSEPECLAEEGFELGRADTEPPPLCQDRDYAEAWQLGRTLGELEDERDELRARVDELDAVEQARLRVLQRDIPELETLARIQGFMEPAQLENPPENTD